MMEIFFHFEAKKVCFFSLCSHASEENNAGEAKRSKRKIAIPVKV
jgi:hypothetical protein